MALLQEIKAKAEFRAILNQYLRNFIKNKNVKAKKHSNLHNILISRIFKIFYCFYRTKNETYSVIFFYLKLQNKLKY